MGLIDNLLDAALASRQPGESDSRRTIQGTTQGSTASNTSNGIAGALLGILASESGRRPASAETDSTGAKTTLSNGLQELIERFQEGGLADVARSWVASGPNRQVEPDQLHQALGSETVDRLSQQTGMPRGSLLSMLAQALPTIVDQLTPNQKVPDHSEMTRMQSDQQSEDQPQGQTIAT